MELKQALNLPISSSVYCGWDMGLAYTVGKLEENQTIKVKFLSGNKTQWEHFETIFVSSPKIEEITEMFWRMIPALKGKAILHKKQRTSLQRHWVQMCKYAEDDDQECFNQLKNNFFLFAGKLEMAINFVNNLVVDGDPLLEEEQ